MIRINGERYIFKKINPQEYFVINLDNPLVSANFYYEPTSTFRMRNLRKAIHRHNAKFSHATKRNLKEKENKQRKR